MREEPTGNEAGHRPVLAGEAMRLLDPRPGDVAVDCTAGRGGHSALLGRAVGPSGLVIGFDLDPGNLAFAARRMAEEGLPFEPVRGSFAGVSRHLAAAGRRADIVLADLGLASSQLDDPSRGFSFTTDGPLDMRYDPAGPVTAADLVARCTERELADLIFRYGEEPLARKIARNLAQARRREPIRTTGQLARLVRGAYGVCAQRSRMHPATRTFMALRIAVNEEPASLQSLLDQVREGAGSVQACGWLMPGARVAIISFHSLEDRPVKRAFAALEQDGLATRLTKRPITAGAAEVQANPRSRSAKLRAVVVQPPVSGTLIAP